MVRLKYTKLITLSVFLVNIILLFYTWKWFLPNGTNNQTSAVASKLMNGANKQEKTNRHIKKAITIIFRDFYHFENDLKHSIDSILNLIPNVQIIVAYEDEPYPPLSFIANYTATHPNVKYINLNFDIRKTSRALSPLLQIKTKLTLFVPDSFRFGGRAIIQKMLNEIEKESNTMKNDNNVVDSLDQSTIQGDNSEGFTTNKNNNYNDKIKATSKFINKKVVIIPFASNAKTMSNCCRINIDIANWTMEYNVKNNTRRCDMVNIFGLGRSVLVFFFK